jgi:hypothetical protein
MNDAAFSGLGRIFVLCHPHNRYLAYKQAVGGSSDSNRGINRGRRNETMALSPGMLLSP